MLECNNFKSTTMAGNKQTKVGDATTTRRTKREAKAAPPPKRTAGQVAWEWTKSLLMGFILFVLLRTFIIQTFTITSGSMEGTLLVGDFLVLSKSAYGATVPGTDFQLPGYTDIDHGDIIVFKGHHEPIDLVKRVVGLPGDTLAMHGGVLHRNGVALEEPYVRHSDPGSDGTHPWMVWQRDFLAGSVDPATYRPTRDDWGPIIVPADSYFVLGDNRDQSLDSRYWGFVPSHDIMGEALVLYFSYDRLAGGLPLLQSVRWSRIGDLLQ